VSSVTTLWSECLGCFQFKWQPVFCVVDNVCSSALRTHCFKTAYHTFFPTFRNNPAYLVLFEIRCDDLSFHSSITVVSVWESVCQCIVPCVLKFSELYEV
jgi:hypothetical protein